jgi:malate dehydrogenase (oxaloacetate-decarboxylating)(NADP+)
MSNTKQDNAVQQLKQAALDFHEHPTRGKISITPTKPLSNQRDLSLAYSPGVAFPCEAIAANQEDVYKYTSRGNLVAVITNGTAVLGLGNIGPYASKPVMEGKGCLFKKFADIDVFDLEINETDPDKLIEIIASLEPTLGGINLEDIKAPECFYIEKKLSERMGIPVFHDDQHGTAVISCAAIINALKVVGKDIDKVKLSVSGAGAAAIACLDLMVDLGMQRSNITVVDSKGVIYIGRGELDASKERYAQNTDKRTLADIMVDADIFLGCSTANVLSPEMVKTMAPKPIILAMANPNPEILPELAKQARPDCIIATGRSDYPNQVNNVLCFPYIFRGALDCGATKITEKMKMACVHAIAELAQVETTDAVAAAYAGEDLRFGPEYIIPKPFDPRLILKIAPAVAKAAHESGVAARPILDYVAYEQELMQLIYHTGMIMRPVFVQAKQAPKRIIYTEGENSSVLRAIQTVVDEGIAKPILIGNAHRINTIIKDAGLRYTTSIEYNNYADVLIIDPHNLQALNSNEINADDYANVYHKMQARNGISIDVAKNNLQSNPTVLASLLVQHGIADGIICGLSGDYDSHLVHIENIIGKQNNTIATLNAVLLEKHNLFIADTFINENPDAQQLADITIMAANAVSQFGIEPKIAMLSHSTFGSSKRTSAVKMREAYDIVRKIAPNLKIEGEVNADAALNEDSRMQFMHNSNFSGGANVLIMPNIDAANIAFNLLKVTSGNGITIGPILMGINKPVHILNTGATTRRIVNMTALISAKKGM